MNKGAHVIDKVRRDIGALLIDPLPRNQLFHIGDFVHVIDVGGALIGVVGKALEGNHFPAFPFKGGFDRRTAYLEGLGDVHSGNDMGRAPLEGAKFNGAGFAADFLGRFVGKEAGGAGQKLMAKGVHILGIIGQLADKMCIRDSPSPLYAATWRTTWA